MADSCVSPRLSREFYSLDTARHLIQDGAFVLLENEDGFRVACAGEKDELSLRTLLNQLLELSLEKRLEASH